MKFVTIILLVLLNVLFPKPYPAIIYMWCVTLYVGNQIIWWTGVYIYIYYIYMYVYSSWNHTHHYSTYLFPSGHPLLQLRVVACFLILISGRVINVYVPIYYKKIINALTPSGQPNSSSVSSLDLAIGFTSTTTGITFPLASILIYIFLRFLQVTKGVCVCSVIVMAVLCCEMEMYSRLHCPIMLPSE